MPHKDIDFKIKKARAFKTERMILCSREKSHCISHNRVNADANIDFQNKPIWSEMHSVGQIF